MVFVGLKFIAIAQIKLIKVRYPPTRRRSCRGDANGLIGN